MIDPESIEDDPDTFEPIGSKKGRFGHKNAFHKSFTGADKERARKFSEMQRKAAKEYHERRRQKLRNAMGQPNRERNEPPRKIQKSKQNFEASYLHWRREVIREWRVSEFRGRCMFNGCPNIPGIDHFVQVDHILDRGRWRQYRMEKWNVVVSCGCHPELDQDLAGRKPTPQRILQIVAQRLPYRFEIVSEKLRESGRM